jgi:hypothetical protein
MPILVPEEAIMNIGATTSTNPFADLSAFQSSQGSTPFASSATTFPALGTTQDSAALQALSATLSSRPPLYDSRGALNTAAASQYFSDLTSSLTSLTSGGGNSALSSTDPYTSLTTQGGLTSSSASLLFGNNSANGSSAFPSSVLNLNASMALASYKYQQSLSSSAAGAASTSSTPTSTIQAAIASAQDSVSSSMFNLIG